MAIINKAGQQGRGDFLGFSFDNRHSSEFRIIRVSSGNRYSTNLFPNQKDTTLDIPGRDGSLLIDSKFQNGDFTINFAFDDMGEEDLMALRAWLSKKTESKLIFDEMPYKYYTVKAKSSPKISYIAFDRQDGSRVYKGEGSVQFVAYYPFAKSVSLYADEVLTGIKESEKEIYIRRNGNSDNFEDWFTAQFGTRYDIPDEAYSSVNAYGDYSYKGWESYQWVQSSGLRPRTRGILQNTGLDICITGVGAGFLHNSGQMPTYLKFILTPPNASSLSGCGLSIANGADILGEINFKEELKNQISGNECILVDSELQLLLKVKNVEYKDNELTYNMMVDEHGNPIILNNYIKSGDFFQVPVTPNKISYAIKGFNTSTSYLVYDFIYY